MSLKSAIKTYGIPEGQRLHSTSTVHNAEGELLRQTVRTDRATDPSKSVPVPATFSPKKITQHLDSQGEVRQTWVGHAAKEQERYDEFVAAIDRAMAKYKGLVDPVVAPPPTAADLMTLYAIGDPHLGMMVYGKETGGDDYDLKIAEGQFYNGIDLLVARAPASALGILANVGDLVHAENDTQLTPHGRHKMDCDSRHGKIIEVTVGVMRRSIDRMLQRHARVMVVNVPGNHDPDASRYIAMMLRYAYEREPRVDIVDNKNPFIYFRFGATLLGFNHGQVKHEKLPAIMAADRKKDWGDTEDHLWITGHVHHDQVKDYEDCTVMSFRTLAPRDAWTNERGYRSKQSIASLTFDKEYGLERRDFESIRRVRAA